MIMEVPSDIKVYASFGVSGVKLWPGKFERNEEFLVD